MDTLLTSGLKHIDAVYYLAEKLVDAKMAPHRIGMGCFTYDKDGMYVCVTRIGKQATVQANDVPTRFDLFSVDGIVAQCAKLGFTSGSVTKDYVTKHREVVEKAWRELCRSLSMLKTEFTYDDVSFLWVNYKAPFQRELNLCLDPEDRMHVRVQIFGRYQLYYKPPSEAAFVLRLLHDFAWKEEGES